MCAWGNVGNGQGRSKMDNVDCLKTVDPELVSIFIMPKRIIQAVAA